MLANARLTRRRRTRTFDPTRWPCQQTDPPAPPEHPLTVIVLAEVARITWDRLEKQKSRSQVRFHLKSGDLLTFSGRLPDPA